MSIEGEFVEILWCNEGTHDKVWGYFLRPTTLIPGEYQRKHHGWNCCIFWGRRGKAMQFKARVTGYDLEKLVRSKQEKGYEKISEEKLFEIWPAFIEEAEGKLMWEVLAGNVK